MQVVVSGCGFIFLLLIFFGETHTFKCGFKKEISINLSLLDIAINSGNYQCLLNKNLTNRSTKYPHRLPTKFKKISSTSKNPILVKN